MCGRSFERRGKGTPLHCQRCRSRAAAESVRVLRVRCAECGREFRTRNRTVRYCSDPCRDRGYRRRGSHPTRPSVHDGTVECQECGRTFKAPSSAYRYCSDTCRKNGYYRRDYAVPRPPAPLKRVECSACGKEFRTTMGPGHRRSYCSAECSAKGSLANARRGNRKYAADPEKHAIKMARKNAWAARRRAEAAKNSVGQCRECGEEFSPAGRGIRYCSDECRRTACARRSLAYYHRRMAGREAPRAKCSVCSAEFAPGKGEGGLRRYCSLACRAEAKRASDRESQRRRRQSLAGAGKNGGSGGGSRRRRQQ